MSGRARIGSLACAVLTRKGDAHVTVEKGKAEVMNDEVGSLHVLLHFLNRYRLRITIMICYLFFIN